MVHGVYTLKRKQIYLEEEQERAAYDAAEEGILNTDKDLVLNLIGMFKGDPQHGSHTYGPL